MPCNVCFDWSGRLAPADDDRAGVLAMSDKSSQTVSKQRQGNLAGTATSGAICGDENAICEKLDKK